MRKERQARKGTGFMNLLFLVVIVWFGYGAYEQGYFDELLGTFEDGHSFTSIEETTCDDLKETFVQSDSVLKKKVIKPYQVGLGSSEYSIHLEEDFENELVGSYLNQGLEMENLDSFDQELISDENEIDSFSDDSNQYSDFSTFVISYLLGNVSLSDYLLFNKVEIEEDLNINMLLMNAYLAQRNSRNVNKFLN